MIVYIIMEQQNNSKRNLKVIISALIIASIGYAAFQFNKSSSLTAAPTPPPAQVPTTLPPALVAMERKYKDGVYKTTGNYTSPGGKEEVTITLTIAGDKVTEATFVGSPKPSATTVKMQTKFMKGFKEFVVGTNIDSISLTVVSGSSLTPKGFMDALEKIKTEATS